MSIFEQLPDSNGASIILWTLFGTFLVSTMALVFAYFLKRQSSLRHTVLLSGLLGCLAVPLATAVTDFIGPIVELPWLAPLRPSVAAEYSASLGSRDAVLPTARSTAGDSPEVAGRPIPLTAEPEEMFRAKRTVSNLKISSLDPWASLASSWLLVAWLLVSSVLSAFAVRSMIQAQRICRRAVLIDCDRWLEAATHAAKSVGLNFRPKLLVCDVIRTPAVVGIRSPVVLLPAELLSALSDEDLTDVLIHEFAHVLRRDSQIVLLQTMARCLFWPVPSVHLLNRELARAREEVCDNFVLDQRDVIQYGEMLLRLGQFAAGQRPLAGALGMLHWQGQLKTRIQRLLDDDRSSRKQTSRVCFLGLLATFLMTGVTVCSTRFVAADSPVTEPVRSSRPTATASEELTPQEDERAAAKPDEEEERETQDGELLLDVSGVAKNASGNPVVGANVHLIAVNDKYKLLATALTDNEGRYSFLDIKSPGNTIDVFATAEGYGLAWHGMRFLKLDSQRPSWEKRGGPRDTGFFKGESIELDLQFLKPSRLHGQVLDENRRPVAGVNLEVSNIDYIKTEGRTSHANFREFWGLRFVPK